jgi:hypothetical protein
MFTALTLSLALGAPVPTPAQPVPTGAAPKILELKANADGKILVSVLRTEKVQIGVGVANPGGGAAPPAVVTRETIVSKQVEIGEVKDLTITTADGKKLETEEALKKLKDGAIVVVSSDGKPVSPAFLKIFKDDTLVLASPELSGPANMAFPGRPIGRPVPLPPQGGPVPVNPGGVIQIQPGVIQIVPAPAAPALPPVPAQPAPAKPVEK